MAKFLHNTKFLTRPAKKKSYGVIAGDLGEGGREGGGTLSDESPSVYLDQSSGLTSAHLGLYIPLYKIGEVLQLAGFSTRQGICRSVVR